MVRTESVNFVHRSLLIKPPSGRAVCCPLTGVKWGCGSAISPLSRSPLNKNQQAGENVFSPSCCFYFRRLRRNCSRLAPILALTFLDTSINMAMQPFKMMVGDMVNERQKAKAYSIQSFLCNAGSLVGFLFPYILTAIGIASVAEAGVVPDSVKWSFYIGAAILILCVIYTTVKVKEYSPEKMAEFREAANVTQQNSATPDTHHGNDGNGADVEKKQNGGALTVFFQVGVVQLFCWAAFLFMWTYTNGTIAETAFGVDMSDARYAATQEYQAAGDWVGVLFAVQAIGSMAWAVILPRFKSVKTAYALSLAVGGIGFVMVPFITDQYMLFVPYLLIGCAWAAMLSMPFTLVTNALEGNKHMGTYLGLFNCTICVPQIVAAASGGVILSVIGSHQYSMLTVAGCLLIIGALCATIIKVK